MPIYNRPPQQGIYKYVRLGEQLLYGNLSDTHKEIAEDILQHLLRALIDNPQDVGAGVFTVNEQEISVLATGARSLNIRANSPGAAEDLNAFRHRSEPYGYRVR
jgi:hypothetical protein